MIRKLQEEVKINRMLANEKLPFQLKERKIEIQLLRALFARSVSPREETSNLESQIREWNDKIRSLSQAKLGSQEYVTNQSVWSVLMSKRLSDERMLMLRQQTSAVAARKSTMSDKLAALMERSACISAELTKNQTIIESKQDLKVILVFKVAKYMEATY
jgi:hypothetical protein